MNFSLNNCTIHPLKIENGELGFAVTTPLPIHDATTLRRLGELAGTEQSVTINMDDREDDE